jgi:hypothetical protein
VLAAQRMGGAITEAEAELNHRGGRYCPQMPQGRCAREIFASDRQDAHRTADPHDRQH